MFTCPHIQTAIRALTPVIEGTEVVDAGPVPGPRVHNIVDPLIRPSRFVARLRSLKESIRMSED